MPGRGILFGLMILTVAALALGAALIGGGASTVVVEVDGVELQARTRAANAEQMLETLGYQVRPEDKLVAPPGRLAPGARIVLERARPVSLAMDGLEQIVWTRARTVTDLLTESGQVLGPEDRIYLNNELVTAEAELPPPVWLGAERAGGKPWERVTQPISLRIERAVPLQILDGGAMPATLFTTAATIGEALAAAQTPIYPGDVVFPSLDTLVEPGQRVVIQRSTPFSLSIDGSTIVTRTRQTTVGAALAEQGVVVFGMDQVRPDLDTPLSPHTEIVVTRIQEDVIYEDELIAFDTVWAPSNAIPIDQKRIETGGHPGVLRHRYRLRYENGEETSRTLEDSWTAVEPETRVIAYGTKITPQTLQTPQGPLTYWRKVRMYATSYSPKRSGTPKSAPWYGRTRLGKTLKKGLVAVDPGVINMRQALYVPGYGEAIAADTGGGVKGRHIDLGYSDDDYRSWHWWVDVYLLWPPPPDYAIHYVLPNWPRYPDNGR